MDKFIGKAEDELNKFMDDPGKVEKAKQKADGLLEKHMDQESAEGITNAAEQALKNVADYDHPSGSH